MSDVLPAPEGECKSMMRPDSNELAIDAASRSRPKNSSSLRNGRGPTYGFTRLLDSSRCAVATTADDEEDPADGNSGEELGSFMTGPSFRELLEEFLAPSPVDIQVVGAEVVLQVLLCRLRLDAQSPRLELDPDMPTV